MAKPEGGRQTRRWLGAGLLVCAIGGCGGKSTSPQPQSSTHARAPVAIPDAPDGCAAFQIEYDATLPSDGCPEVGCRCSYQGPTPTPKNGCVVAVDCSAACAAPDGDAWLVCAIEGCAADADCEQPGVCEAQVCKSGGAGACGSKHCTGSDVCVAVAADGTRRCVTPSDRSACNADADCVEGHCALPDGSFLGLCTTG